MDFNIEIKALADQVAALKDAAEKKSSDALEAVKNLEAKFADVATPAQLEALKGELQKQFDELATKSRDNKPVEAKDLFTALKETVNEDVIAKLAQDFDKNRSATIQLPAGTKLFSIAGSLTGDPVVTYSPRQAILPSSPVNFRDLIPSVSAPTGNYVTYRENSGAANNIGIQNGEGSTKPENDYNMTEIKTVTEYVAGTTDFTKQAMKMLPFITNTLPRLLQRDFFLAENALFYNIVEAAASAPVSSSETDKVKKLIDLIAKIRDTRFVPSFALVSNAVHAQLLFSTYDKGYYAGAGSVSISGTSLNINGVPVVPADFAEAGKVMLVDSTFVERVETEALNIQFSYENGENFKKNLVTARLECMEDLNILLPQAHYVGTL